MTNQLFKPEDRARLAKVAATEPSSLCMDVEVYPNFAMIGLLLIAAATRQAAKRESRLGTAGWPEVRHVKYTEETHRGV